MKEYLTFRRMITPSIVQFLFWVISVGVLVAVLVLVGMNTDDFTGRANDTGEAYRSLFLFVGGALLFIVLLRIYAEIVLVTFRINETLTEIKNLKSRS